MECWCEWMFFWAHLPSRGIAGKEHWCQQAQRRHKLRTPNYRQALWRARRISGANWCCTSSKTRLSCRQCSLHLCTLGIWHPRPAPIFPSTIRPSSCGSLFRYTFSIADPSYSLRIFPPMDAPGRRATMGHFWGLAYRDELFMAALWAILMILVSILCCRGANAKSTTAGDPTLYMSYWMLLSHGACLPPLILHLNRSTTPIHS